eukprot:1040059-Pelagomonas_calceolata.AAC.6
MSKVHVCLPVCQAKKWCLVALQVAVKQGKELVPRNNIAEKINDNDSTIANDSITSSASKTSKDFQFLGVHTRAYAHPPTHSPTPTLDSICRRTCYFV